MRLIQLTMLAALAMCVTTSGANAQEEFFSTPVAPEDVSRGVFGVTGLTLSYSDDKSWVGQCSGAVAVDRRVMLSAAHCIYDKDNAKDPWIPNTEFFLQWNKSESPKIGQGKALRGAYFLTDYSSAVSLGADGVAQKFDLDFAAHFGYEQLAETAVGIYQQNIARLESSAWKVVVGYPSGLYAQGDPNEHKMHYTGPFNTPCPQIEGSFTLCPYVQSGPGNSGGPTFGWDAQSTSWSYIGTLVAGASKEQGADFNFVGINAFSDDEALLLKAALDGANSDDGGTGNSPGDTDNPPGNTEEPLPAYIYVTGNEVHIAPGDNTPSKEDGTNFGTATKKKKITRSFLVANLGDEPFSFAGKKSFRIKGSGAKYFKLGKIKKTSLGSLEGFYLPITFKASPKKSFKATVEISSDAPNAPTYSFAIKAKRK